MSEQTFSPGAPAPVSDPDGGVEESGSAGRMSRKTVLVAGAVGLVIAVAAYFLFFSGGSSDPSADTGGVVPKATAPAGTKVKPAVSASASAKPGALPPVQSGSIGRDPFKPLINPPAPTPTAVAASPSTAPSTSASSGTTVPTSGVPNILTVTKVDQAAGVVGSTVNGKAYSAVLGGTFAKYFKLIAIGPTASCAVFQYGDVTVPLCKGQSLTLTG